MKKIITILFAVIGFVLLFSCIKKNREKKIVGQYYVAAYNYDEHTEENNDIIDRSEIMVGSDINGTINYDFSSGSNILQSYTINNSLYEYDFNEDETWTRRWNRTRIFYLGTSYIEIITNEVTSGIWAFNQEIFTIDLTILKTVTTNPNTLEVDEIFYTTENTITYFIDLLKRTEMSITRNEENDCTNSSVCTNTTLETIHLTKK
jgi:hypothetical protein